MTTQQGKPHPPQNSSTTTSPPPHCCIVITRTYEFKVYTLVSEYTQDYELLTTICETFKDKYINCHLKSPSAKEQADDFARNIGLLGITVENPHKFFTYYPPSHIAKVEYIETTHDYIVVPPV